MLVGAGAGAGAGGGPRTLAWIARHADGWMTTPIERDISEKVATLRTEWARAGRAGQPAIHVLAASKPTPELLAGWEALGVTEAIRSFPDRDADEASAFVDRLAARLGLC